MIKILLSSLFLIYGCTRLSAQTDEKSLANQYMENGDTRKAVDIYQKLYQQNRNEFYNSYFNGLMSLKNFDQAEVITKEMLEKQPKNYQYVIALGRVFREKGNGGEADEIYNNLIDKMPADERTIGEIAWQFSRGQNIDFAIKAYLQGRKLLKKDQLFAYDLGNLYRSKNNKGDMIREYLAQLIVKPSDLVWVKRDLSSMLSGTKDYALLKTALQKMTKEYPDKIVFADLWSWQFLQQEQFDLAIKEAIALNRQQNDDGRALFELCKTLIVNGAYEDAIKGFQYLIEKGKQHPLYVQSRIEFLETNKLKFTTANLGETEFSGLEKEYLDLLSELGKNNATAVAMESLAKIQLFKLKKADAAEHTLSDLIAIKDLPAELLSSSKLELGDLYLINGKIWDATLMYSQVEKAFEGRPEGQEAQFRNAKLAYYTGDFEWAKKQLDELKAATTALIDNDALNLWLMIGDHTAFDSTANALKMYARADLLIFREEPDRAAMTLDSINVAYPLNDLANDISMAKARILIQKNDYKGAAESLAKITSGSPDDLWADDAAFMLGDIFQNHLDDKSMAQRWYQKIITDYPGSLWVDEARKRFRILRGDDKSGL